MRDLLPVVRLVGTLVPLVIAHAQTAMDAVVSANTVVNGTEYSDAAPMGKVVPLVAIYANIKVTWSVLISRSAVILGQLAPVMVVCLHAVQVLVQAVLLLAHAQVAEVPVVVEPGQVEVQVVEVLVQVEAPVVEVLAVERVVQVLVPVVVAVSLLELEPALAQDRSRHLSRA